MQAEPTLADDEETPATDAPAGLPLFEAAGVEIPPYVEELTQGQPLGPVMKKLYVSMQKRQAREPEEKPFELPLMDEEEIAEIADPHEREQKRRQKIAFYKQYPNVLAHYMERSEQLKAERKKLLRLPVIPQETRPAVNVICNSALFAAVQGKDRQLLNKRLLDTQDGVEIIFSGEQFNQDDHDVLMQLVYLASQHELGEPITVSAHSLLKALGRGTSGKEHDQLKAEIERLVDGTIYLKTKRFDYVGHLIDDAQQDKKTRFWTYRANPTLGKFYDVNNYTLIDWESRKALKGKALARWLQLQLASHAHPFPMKVETIRRLSGSRAKSLRHFREQLRIALDDLKANGSITSWQIDESDKAHVDRGDAISASQQRHLAKPANRRRLPKPQG